MAVAGLTIDDVAARLDVDAKTVQRWVTQGRQPHRTTRDRLAQLLRVPTGQLWEGDGPTPVGGPQVAAQMMWPTRSAVPPRLWSELLDQAEDQVDICAYAVMFLFESDPGFTERLRTAVGRGVKVRIALAAPNSDQALAKGEAEGIGAGLQALATISWTYLAPAAADLELREHDLALPGSIYRFDSQVLWNPYLAGLSDRESPVLRLPVAAADGMAATAAKSFEWVWEHALPHN
jgi:hypothetical protein